MSHPNINSNLSLRLTWQQPGFGVKDLSCSSQHVREMPKAFKHFCPEHVWPGKNENKRGPGSLCCFFYHANPEPTQKSCSEFPPSNGYLPPLLIPNGFKALCQGGHSLTVTTTVPRRLYLHPVPTRWSQRVLRRSAKSAWGSLPAMEVAPQQQLGRNERTWAMGTAGQAPAQAGQEGLWNRMV